jgi:hypothetical protein
MRIYNHREELTIDEPSMQAKSKGSFNLKKRFNEGGVPGAYLTMKKYLMTTNFLIASTPKLKL